MNFSKSLIQWYLLNKRDLPWRNTTDPYLIWLSEIMLQQTRVAQGLPYFLRFTEAFPTVFDLAEAEEEQVLKLWQGLGYYSRARNLHQTAQKIASDYQGQFPQSYSELLQLKGIGDYTAAAIASFAYNESVPVVDGNVYRVLARYFEVETDIASSDAKKEFTALARELLPKGEANVFNQAIMEFGAMQCVPKNPDCNHCIFNDSCAALQKKKVAALPVKSKKNKVKDRWFHYVIFADEQHHTLVQKRSAKGIWHNLYEFPLIETTASEPEADVEKRIVQQKLVPNAIQSVHRDATASTLHKLSHQHLHIDFWKVRVKGTLKGGTDWESVKKLPFPVVIFNFIEKERY
ncbi:A/G-specific adenine glycosylase [Flavobacterium sedimenticola]|uniref:Adenine DNA glycosylase n=1 Tax=Flavobacterium sedimenticola TaxID=3043286 RepID=A0ABT6XLL1_9FLAO|nr:A/G-specific adenine glycosylase [Flavobacterium sedimenticola]MDI9255877.1 A/G-specific adenine glycosylase [Flavobacterium sedimenticola]